MRLFYSDPAGFSFFFFFFFFFALLLLTTTLFFVLLCPSGYIRGLFFFAHAMKPVLFGRLKEEAKYSSAIAQQSVSSGVKCAR